MNPPYRYWYKLGFADAKESRYPLYSVLVIAGRFVDAREYAEGWKAATNATLSIWYDHSADT